MRFFAHKQVFPTFAESVDSGEVQELNIKEGQFVSEGQLLAVIDIEKSTIELFAEKGGLVTKLFVKEGDNVRPKDNFIEIDDKAIDANAATAEIAAEAPKPKAEEPKKTSTPEVKTVAASPTPVKAAVPVKASAPAKPVPTMIVTDFVATTERTEYKEKMTMLRRMIANRLKASQNNNALLTTFNEIDMGNIIDMRKKYQDIFTKKHGIKIGFMGFFLKASSYALDCYPIINSAIENNEIIHRN